MTWPTKSHKLWAQQLGKWRAWLLPSPYLRSDGINCWGTYRKTETVEQRPKELFSSPGSRIFATNHLTMRNKYNKEKEKTVKNISLCVLLWGYFICRDVIVTWSVHLGICVSGKIRAPPIKSWRRLWRETIFPTSDCDWMNWTRCLFALIFCHPQLRI